MTARLARSHTSRGAASAKVGVLALGLFLFGLACQVVAGLRGADETWFLQVLDRVGSGEVLYRDVFFGATPLSVEVALPLTALFGTEVIVGKLFLAALFAGGGLATLLVARELRMKGPWTLGLPVLAAAVYAPLATHYTSLSLLFLMLALGAVLAWLRSPSPGMRAAALAGGAAGLCFASKQNYGVYALLAVTAVFLLLGDTSRRERVRALAVTTAVFALAAILPLVPVWLSGGGDALVDFGFANKGRYVGSAGVSYLDGVGNLFTELRLRRDRPALAHTAFLLAPLALATLTWTLLRVRTGRDEVGAMFIFCVAALAGVFPRANVGHLTPAMPFVALGITLAADRLAPTLPRALGRPVLAVSALWLGAGLLVTVVSFAMPIARGERAFADLPHLRGALIDPRAVATLRSDAELIATAARREGPLLVLSPPAGTMYLVSGARNPTRYDYPLVTAMGLNGEREVARSVRTGGIRTVCLDLGYGPPSLHPVVLERAVTEALPPGRRLSGCRLYGPAPERPTSEGASRRETRKEALERLQKERGA